MLHHDWAQRACKSRSADMLTSSHGPTTQVVYLAVASFLDKRTEDEERKKFAAAQKDRCVSRLSCTRQFLQARMHGTGVELGF